MSGDEATAKCRSIDDMLDVFGRKWTARIFSRLLYADRRMGFNELLRATPGINPKMLADRLKSLEANNVVKREVEKSPLRSYYSLTEAGRDLRGVVETMLRWSERWGAAKCKK